MIITLSAIVINFVSIIHALSDISLPFSSPSRGIEIVGAVTGDFTGYSVSGVGDVNNDGHPDVIIGAKGAQSTAGVTYVIFGNDSSHNFDNINLPATEPTTGFRIFGVGSSGQSGFSVSGAGDVNGDGIDDFMIGAPISSLVYVIYGHDGATVTQPDILLGDFTASPTTGFKLIGLSTYRVGSCISKAGDVNGDGVQDLIVNAPEAETNTGITYIIFGNHTREGNIQLDTLSEKGLGFQIMGAYEHDQAGYAVSDAGDVNGDGVDDFLLAAPFFDSASTLSVGITYVIFGRNTSDPAVPPFGNMNLGSFVSSELNGYRIIGAEVENGQSGWSVSGIGDFNGDDYADIITTSSWAFGNALVIFGTASWYYDISLESWNSFSHLGFKLFGAYQSLSGAGDVNGDGYDDIICSYTDSDPATVYVIYGYSGSPLSFDDIDLWSWEANNDHLLAGFFIKGGNQVGWSVSSAGDFNGDGYDDMIMGAPPSNTEGAVYIVYGMPRVPTSQPSTQPSSQPSRHPIVPFIVYPSSQPTSQPSRQPSGQPNAQPTRQPVNQPSRQPSAQPSRQPTRQPSSQPSRHPTKQPSAQPSRQPSSKPSAGPTAQPSSQPSSQPSQQPSRQPSRQPSSQPTAQPSRQPTSQPSSKPTTQPSAQPSSQPSRQPSKQPSTQPSGSPSVQPSGQPTIQPSRQPSTQPSCQPTSQPTGKPSGQPSGQPTRHPSAQPSVCPSCQPSVQPTRQPSSQPSRQPSNQPSAQPSCKPSRQPSVQPTGQPSVQPSRQPSAQPSSHPTSQPSALPTMQPSKQPSAKPSRQPSSQPSARPSAQPSGQPTSRPTLQPSGIPSSQPSNQPSQQPTSRPSAQPTCRPSAQPSGQPLTQPTSQPSKQPSDQPTRQPCARPSSQPSGEPSTQPTAQPSSQPSGQPSAQPTLQPSAQPSKQPSSQPSCQPSGQPSHQPTAQPSTKPTIQPSSLPSAQPSCQPSLQPSSQPTAQPSDQPSSQPSSLPSGQPSIQPSSQASAAPSAPPSARPTYQITCSPTAQPSAQPSNKPSGQPTCQPSVQPSSEPTSQPSRLPSSQPSSEPSSQPSRQPSSQPSVQPTGQPLGYPTQQPSAQPTVTPSNQPSSQPTVQPSRCPSIQPSAQPSAQPSRQPNAKPSAQPTSQPSTQPSRQPTGQPSSRPSSQPTGAPSDGLLLATGEWVLALGANFTAMDVVSVVDDNVWVCGDGGGGATSVTCVLVVADAGLLRTKFAFPWDMAVSALTNKQTNGVAMSANSVRSGVAYSQIAICSFAASLLCSVMELSDTSYTVAVSVPYSREIVYMGQYNALPSITIVELSATGTVIKARSYVYTPSAVRSVKLTHSTSVPNFAGVFLAGTGTITSNGASVTVVVAGWVNSASGVLSATYLTPVNGFLSGDTDFVNAITMAGPGPDSLIAGGLQVQVGSGSSTIMNAYLVRMNALYKTASFGVKFVSKSGSLVNSVVKGMVSEGNVVYLLLNMASLTSRGSGTSQSLVNGMASRGSPAYHTLANAHTTIREFFAVLKVNAITGAVVQQISMSVPDANVSCTDITASTLSLVLTCATQNAMTLASSAFVVATNRDLSFKKLPVGWMRNSTISFTPLLNPFEATSFAAPTASKVISTSSFTYSTLGQTPTWRPTVAPTIQLSSRPTVQPSVQPLGVPSGQPSSSPTSAPSISPLPTSHPSTGGPTNTYKPTVKPTQVPSVAPTLQPSMRPSAQPSVDPTAAPTQQPSEDPSVTPSVSPTTVPSQISSMRPTRIPTVRPSKRSSVAPSMAGTVTDDYLPPEDSGKKGGDETEAMVVGLAAAGGALGFGLLAISLCAMCSYRLRKNREKYLAKQGNSAKEPLSPRSKVDPSRTETSETVSVTFPGVRLLTPISSNSYGYCSTPPSSSDGSYGFSSVHSSDLSDSVHSHGKTIQKITQAPQTSPPQATRELSDDYSFSSYSTSSVDLSSLHDSEMSDTELSIRNTKRRFSEGLHTPKLSRARRKTVQPETPSAVEASNNAAVENLINESFSESDSSVALSSLHSSEQSDWQCGTEQP